jgi:hypothetical protein
VLRADKELLVLPVISFLAILLASTGIGLLAWAGGRFDARQSFPEGIDYVFLFAFYFVAYFIGIFFNAAVVGAATIRLQGGDPTVRDGLRLASSKLAKIAVWAAISATVGIILRSLEERFGFLGRLVINLIGVAWSVITFFVVPVLLYEPLGVVDGIKRSARIFKQRWGETFVGTGSIAIAIFILALPVIALAVGLGVLWPPLGITVGILGIGGLVAVGSAIAGIFNAALYRFATSGEATGTFTSADLEGAFKPKRGG